MQPNYKYTTRTLASTRIYVLARVSVKLALALALAFSLLALARYSHFWLDGRGEGRIKMQAFLGAEDTEIIEEFGQSNNLGMIATL